MLVGIANRHDWGFRVRDKSIDALRGLAILLVVAGHATALAAVVSHGGPGLVPWDTGLWLPIATVNGLPYLFIYSFHMPLFAFVSGYVLHPPREAAVAAQIIRRARALLVPFFAWALLRLVLPFGGDGVASNQGLVGSLLDILLGRTGLWYLYALFICSVVLICLLKLRGMRWLLPVSAVAAAVCAASLWIPDILWLAETLWIYPFVVLGFMISPLNAEFVSHRWSLFGACLAAYVALFYFQSPLGTLEPPIRRISEAALRGTGLSLGWVVWLFPYLCATAAVLALYSLYIRRSGWAIDAQAWLGRRSLGIYAMHASVIRVLLRVGVTNVLVLILSATTVAVLLTLVLERIPGVNMVFLGQKGSRREAPDGLDGPVGLSGSA